MSQNNSGSVVHKEVNIFSKEGTESGHLTPIAIMSKLLRDYLAAVLYPALSIVLYSSYSLTAMVGLVLLRLR